MKSVLNNCSSRNLEQLEKKEGMKGENKKQIPRK
uniref:Uncharacterized protein n=1 Tax=Rhizophora mucronata TaxID=61149 RepID=A0A2P2IKD0_RHIMU